MFRRNISEAVLAALSDSPVVFLNGARQTGKSTLTQALAQNSHPARYVTLDDIGLLAAAKSDPQGFLAGLKGPVIIDEIQRAPELYLPIKAEVDRDRRPGRFLLTGSASALVLPELAHALAGRMEILTLWPLSQGEIGGVKEGFIDILFETDGPLPLLKSPPREDLWDRVARGGYPEPLGRPQAERRRAWADSYVTTLIERDVRDLANVEGLTQLPRLLSLLAARTAGLMNYAELSRSMGLPQTTLKRYLALLEATFLVNRLPPWSGNARKRLVKAPKCFLNDTGLAASLLAIDAQRLKEDGALSGPLLENFVMTELAKQSAWSRARPRLHHFRTESGLEVDIVLEDARGRCVGIKVKSGAPGNARGLKALQEAAGKKFLRGVILYTGREIVPFSKNIHAIPIESMWHK